MEFDLATFESMHFDEVGNNVLEFELNGSKYDVFKIEETSGKMRLLVKHDKFESVLNTFQKSIKRALRTRSERIKSQVFNFLYFEALHSLKTVLQSEQMLQSILKFSLQQLHTAVDSPPPDLV
ncbi:MAG: hypothetical protein NWS53_07570 [Salibacteraceae bacterium]|nr:hypothetical protein [Salibacteraceae bacterium]